MWRGPAGGRPARTAAATRTGPASAGDRDAEPALAAAGGRERGQAADQQGAAEHQQRAGDVEDVPDRPLVGELPDAELGHLGPAVTGRPSPRWPAPRGSRRWRRRWPRSPREACAEQRDQQTDAPRRWRHRCPASRFGAKVSTIRTCCVGTATNGMVTQAPRAAASAGGDAGRRMRGNSSTMDVPADRSPMTAPTTTDVAAIHAVHARPAAHAASAELGLVRHPDEDAKAVAEAQLRGRRPRRREGGEQDGAAPATSCHGRQRTSGLPVRATRRVARGDGR